MTNKAKQFIGETYYDRDGQIIWGKLPNGDLNMLANLRGWGAIQNMFDSQTDAELFQDTVGNFISKAINTFIDSKILMKPHNFRDMIGELREVAIEREGSQSLRDALHGVVEKYIKADHLKVISNEEYWKTRCLLAESFIEESPCDPDITDEQVTAHLKWISFKSKENYES